MLRGLRDVRLIQIKAGCGNFALGAERLEHHAVEGSLASTSFAHPWHSDKIS